MKLTHLSPRRELRFALLAAMETCWVYAISLFFGNLLGLHTLSPLSLFAAYWIALVAGRFLPRLKDRSAPQQATAAVIALLTLLVIVRLEIYLNYGWLDIRWLTQYELDLLAFTEGLDAALLATLGVLYMFLRGLGFAQRPLTLWFTGFQFRLGIVVFFLLFVVAGFVRRFDASSWIFVYFFLGLVAIALARIDEMGSRLALGPRWSVTLLAAVALVLFLGLGILQVLTLEAVNAVVAFFAPLGVVVGTILFILVLPFGYLAGWLIELLSPIFQNLRNLGQMFNNLLPAGLNDALQKPQENLALLDMLGPLLKTGLVVAFVVGIGYLLARALNQRMKQAEDETYIRETIGDAEYAERALAARRRAKPAAHRAGNMAAESIRRIYAALVARAAEAGLPRRTAETPSEFLPRLQHTFPEQADQVHKITEAYIAVHYGEYQAPVEEVNRVRAAWDQVKRRINARRKI